MRKQYILINGDRVKVLSSLLTKDENGLEYPFDCYLPEMVNGMYVPNLPLLVVKAAETLITTKKKELADYADSLGYFTVEGNEYSTSITSVAKMRLAKADVWKTETKEWYERDYTVKFMTTKPELEQVLAEVDYRIQLKRVEIFGAVT